MSEVQRGPWLFRTLGKVGIGNMNQRVHIAGNTTVTTPPPGPTTSVTQGGLFAQGSNIGDFEQNKICFVPVPFGHLTLDISERALDISAER